MIPEPLSCHVPCFIRMAKQTKRGRKRYRNRHEKAQRLFNRVGFQVYWDLLCAQRSTVEYIQTSEV